TPRCRLKATAEIFLVPQRPPVADEVLDARHEDLPLVGRPVLLLDDVLTRERVECLEQPMTERQRRSSGAQVADSDVDRDEAEVGRNCLLHLWCEFGHGAEARRGECGRMYFVCGTHQLLQSRQVASYTPIRPG